MLGLDDASAGLSILSSLKKLTQKDRVRAEISSVRLLPSHEVGYGDREIAIPVLHLRVESDELIRLTKATVTGCKLAHIERDCIECDGLGYFDVVAPEECDFCRELPLDVTISKGSSALISFWCVSVISVDIVEICLESNSQRISRSIKRSNLFPTNRINQ